MSIEWFKARVHDTAPGHLPADAIRQAVTLHEKQGRLHRGDVAECLALARQIAAQDSRHPRRADRTSPEARTVTLGLVQAIEPSVAEIRRQLFENEQPPFTSLRAAAAWIEQQAAAQPRQSRTAKERQTDAKRAAELVKRIRPHLLELGTHLGVNARVTTSIETLAYQRPRQAWVSRVAVELGDRPLHVLQAGVAAIAHATGFAEDAVTSHVLAGTQPELRAAQGRMSRHSGRLPDGRSITRSFATIEINVREVSYAALRRLYHQVRRAWKGPKTRGVTPRDDWLRTTVAKLGGVPRRQPWSKKFWEQVYVAARKANYDDGSWRTSMMGYRRLLKKLAAAPQLARTRRRSRARN